MNSANTTMRTRPFAQVDVFTHTPYYGNPVAVVLDADGLDTDTMQRFAHWTNLSETTFVFPPDDAGADYRVRIFTPGSELPFAGHPTLGTAHALIEAGRITPRNGQVVQQSAVGLVPVSVSEQGLAFRLPDDTISPAPDAKVLTDALNTPCASDPVIVNVGPNWVIIELADGAAVRAVAPNFGALADYDRTHGTTGLTVFGMEPDGTAVVRSFAPADGIPEDPVCGSGNGAVAAYRRAMHGTRIDYTASQGREVGRDGRITIRYDGDAILVGGQCVTAITGFVQL